MTVVSSKTEGKMKKINRGINNQAFIDVLNELRKDENSFWYKMVNDEDLFIAIRDEYVNVYYSGQSICEFSYLKRKKVVKGKTHEKYLGIEGTGYASSENGKISSLESVIKDLNELSEIKENVKKHIEKEKGESYKVILNKESQVIDTEATFVEVLKPNPKKEKGYQRSSIDYVALEKNSENEIKIVFYEAKHYSNPEIRSTEVPKVVEQINRYEEALKLHEKEYKQEIINTYKLICQNLKDLNIVKNRNLVEDVNTSNLVIDFQPKLIVFGFGSDAHARETWEEHKKNIEKGVGKQRLILK